jgi:flagellar biosynthesis protein FlhF
MKIKKMYVDTEREAIKKVKEEYGDEAVILHMKKKRTGLFGFGKKKIEVLIAIDNKMANTTPKPSKSKKFSLEDFVNVQNKNQFKNSEKKNTTYSINEIIKKNREFSNSPIKSNNTSTTQKKSESIDNREINELKEMISDLKNEIKKMKNDNIKIPKNLLRIFTYLVDVQELKEDATKEIVMQAAALYKDEDEKSLPFIFNTIGSFISPSQELSIDENPLKILLMGPTGVGKTTTIAKIAARYYLMKKVPTGLITIDTYRIAAVDQLKVYASIMGLPVEVVYSLSEVNRAISNLSSNRLILVDTAGRSPNNTMQMSELKSFVNALKIDKKILTLSATMKRRDMNDTIKKFKDIGIDGLIFTKIDETSSYGNLIDIAMDFNYPILYFTNGQNIPDDILIGNGKFISQLMLKKYKEEDKYESS